MKINTLKLGSKLKWLLPLAAMPLLMGGSCGTPAPGYLVLVRVTWQSPADMDSHVWATPTDHCWVDACTTANVTGPTDDITGASGEEITIGTGAAAGTYRFGVNLHEFPVGSTPGDRTVNIEVSYSDGSGLHTANYGPYVLNTPIGHGGYPVTGSTASWWRPFDVIVLPNGTAQLQAADSTPCQGP